MKKFIFDAKMPLKLFFDLSRSFVGHSEVIWGLNQRSLLKKPMGVVFTVFRHEKFILDDKNAF